MADGSILKPLELAAAVERRGPMRPARLTSPRVRLCGALLAQVFMAVDAACLALSVVALGVANGIWRAEVPIAAALAFGLMLACGAYDFRPRETAWLHLSRVLAALSGGLIAPLAVAAVLHPAQVVVTEIAWASVLVAGFSALHVTWFAIVARLDATGKLTPNLVIVGATQAAERLVHRALQSPGAVNIIGVFDDRRGRNGPTVAGVPILGGVADLVGHRILPYVDRIIITIPAGASRRIAELTALLETIPNPVTLLFDKAEAADERAAVERIANLSLREISAGERSIAGRIAKRAVDLVASCTAVVLLAPVYVGVALAVRLDSPGPILFRQKRHGYFNEEFVVFKFRSMRVEAEDAQARRQVTQGDDRVTRVGQLIRKTSLDELPQLFNVIRGEMSLVGPRPHAIGMLVGGEDATRLLKTYGHRHRIKPGLTGWAAIRGSRGPVDTPEAVRRRVALDLEYIERQSFWLDLLIMLLTLPCLLGDRRAVR